MNKLTMPYDKIVYAVNHEFYGIIDHGWELFLPCGEGVYQKYYIFDTEENMNLFKMKYMS